MQFPHLRFGMRTLLILTVLVAIPSAWLGKHWLRTRVQRPIVAKIIANGGNVTYDYQYDGDNYDFNKSPPGWESIRSLLGDDFFACVIQASCGFNSKPGPLSIHFEDLNELRGLNLEASKFDDQTIARLASLKKLEGLGLHNLKFKPETLKKLTTCPALTQLTLQGTELTNEHLRELINFPRLTYFQFINSPLDDDGLLAICELKNLETLDLLWSNSTPQLTERGYASLSQLTKLQKFQLSGPADDGIAAIANLPELESVLLWADQLTDNGLLKMSTLNQLVVLKIDSGLISDAGLKALRGMPKLEWLQLASPNFTDAGLSNLNGLTRLKHLELNFAGITDAGLTSLLPLTELEELDLLEAKLTDQGLQQLVALSKLKRLTITLSPSLTVAGVKQLRGRLTECKFFDYQASPGGGGITSEIP